MGKNELIAIAKMEKKGFPKQIFFYERGKPPVSFIQTKFTVWCTYPGSTPVFQSR
jgi:hypothetical protein